ncbi:MAG: type VI secretion system contractile sheath small subunit [Chitinispirillaceae bacterium]|nr:type VI secretion system contractile sheath small subunit [Chitinispirillaceae bacterium]
MNKDESPIHSMNVRLGTSAVASSASSLPQLQPWVILVCSDLGFISGKPCSITAATLNEVMSANEVTISGTVEAGLPADIAPFYIEHRIGDLKDLSPAALPDRLPALQQLKNVSTLLDDIVRKRIAPAEGFKRIASVSSLPQSVVRQLGTIVKGGGPASTGPAASSSKIDSILSMMEVDASKSVAPPKTPPADFVAALTERAEGDVSPAALLTCKESIDSLINALCDAVVAQPFFSAAVSSWNGLKTLLKIAGRRREVLVYLHSAPYDAAQRHFTDALAFCASESCTPDLVIWDYAVPVDTATLQQLEHIGAAADQYKTAVAASLDYNDDLYKKILNQEPLKTALEQPAFIPLLRLQETSSARCLALCAPDALQQSQSDQRIRVKGAWLLAFQWVASVLENSSPFHLQNSSITALDGFAFPKLSSETVFDANRCGITLLRPNSTTAPRVLFGNTETPYGSLLFNLLVNRTARLAAGWIGGRDTTMTVEAAAPALTRFLQTQLRPYHILSSDESVAVSAAGESLQVTVDSDITVAGFPVKFQFSFNCRE